jgi:serine/threonine-protein kinase
MDGAMDETTRHDAPADDEAIALGDYVLGARLARRPAADVYEAVHVPTGAPRLVYVLRPGAMQDHPLVHRVVCEVDAARWLRHPAIAKVDGYGDTPSRRLYLGVERAPGRTLRALRAEGERLPAWRVARLASRLVEALDEAHAVGLTHGRLTPDAAVLAPEAEAAGAPPLVTLVGLGAGAVAFDGEVPEGDRPFVSPEQLAGRDADARSDVFGLASLLQLLLTDEVPAEVAPDAAPAVSTAADGHRPTTAVLAAARAADPRHRPATVKAFWEELLAALVSDAAAAASLGPTAVAAREQGAAEPATSAPIEQVLRALEFELLELDGAALEELAPAASTSGEPAFDHAAARTVEPAPAAPTTVAPAAQTSVSAAPTAPAAPRAPYPTRRLARLRPPLAPSPELAPPVPVRSGRGRRTLVTLAWCLGVPALAAAVGWPLAHGVSFARDARDGETAPVMPIVAPAPARPAPPPSTIDSVFGPPERPAPTRALPTVPTLDVPVIDVPTVDARPARALVRPEEFTQRVTP